MTHCRNLDDYLDRDLPPAAREGFEHHLLECAECSAAVAQSGDLYAALAVENDVPRVDEIAGRLQQVFAASVDHDAFQVLTPVGLPSGATVAVNRDVNRTVPWQWIAAAAAIVLIAGVLALQLLGSEDEFAADSQPPSGVDATGDRNRKVDAILAERNSLRAGTDEVVSQSSQAAVDSNEPGIVPSLVRQVGESDYDQLKVKSNNPKVTIVWMMEPPGKGEEAP